MEWAKYQKLSKNQKEEYNFKFLNKDLRLKSDRFILGIISIMSVYTVLMFMYYLFITDERFTADIETLKLMFDTSYSLLRTGLIIIISIFVFDVIFIWYYIIKKWVWMRKNSIRILPK